MVIEIHAKIIETSNQRHRWVIWYIPIWDGRRRNAYQSVVISGDR